MGASKTPNQSDWLLSSETPNHTGWLPPEPALVSIAAPDFQSCSRGTSGRSLLKQPEHARVIINVAGEFYGTFQRPLVLDHLIVHSREQHHRRGACRISSWSDEGPPRSGRTGQRRAARTCNAKNHGYDLTFTATFRGYT